MTKFVFRLDTALRVRKLRADAETAKLQELGNQKRRFENWLSDLQKERAEASLFLQGPEGAGAGDFRALSAFTIGLEARAKTLREALARTGLQIEDQKRRVLEAQRDELALQKLRTKRHAEWAVAAEREIDDTAQELWLCSHTKSKEAPNHDCDQE